MESETYIRSSTGSGIVNTDAIGYDRALARRKQAKYIKGLEHRIEKLESALLLLQNTVKEITK